LQERQFAIPYAVEKEGFYYLTSSRWRVRVYLRPTDHLQLSIDNSSGLITALEGSTINHVLYQWQQLIAPITAYGYNKTDDASGNGIDLSAYLKTYQQLQPQMNLFADKLHSLNSSELRAIQTAMQLDRELAPIKLLHQVEPKKQETFGTISIGFADVPAAYQQFIDSNKFQKASILMLGEGRSLIELYAKMNLAMLSKEKRGQLSKGEKLRWMMNSLPNDTLKAFFLNDQMEQPVVNNLSEFREVIKPLQQYTHPVTVKKTYDQLYQSFTGDTAFNGKLVYNFSLPDTSGRMVSLQDLRGKVVLIDFWASWCGPCKVQIPFLKQLEEEYRDNKDLVFVGISIDRAEQKQQWLQLIRKEKLAGLQLLDEGGQYFSRKNKVVAIPRFMLIDKEGRWIEVRCPRPEAKEELKQYLDKALGESIANQTKDAGASSSTNK